MSALGQKQTFPRVRLMSALAPKADIRTGLQPRNSGRRLHGECVLRLPLLHTHGLALGRVWVALLGKATDSTLLIAVPI